MIQKTIVDIHLRKIDTESMESTLVEHEATSQLSQSLESHSKQPSRLIGVGIASFIILVLPIVGAFALNAVSMKQNQPLISPVGTPTNEYIPAIQTSAQSEQTGTTQIEYELSLAERFLAKAIELSNTTPQQTEKDKEQIIFLLNQALESANRAITLNDHDARVYTSRGRIYQAISLIKPEMKELALADFAKASSLGSSNPTQAIQTEDPLELLPTKQATNTLAQKAMIAAPEERTTSTVSSSNEQNAQKGTVTLNPGETEVYVPYSTVSSTTQLYVTAENNPENITLYVKNKEEGKGFTIGSTKSSTAPITITWWEVK